MGQLPGHNVRYFWYFSKLGVFEDMIYEGGAREASGKFVWVLKFMKFLNRGV